MSIRPKSFSSYQCKECPTDWKRVMAFSACWMNIFQNTKAIKSSSFFVRMHYIPLKLCKITETNLNNEIKLRFSSPI